MSIKPAPFEKRKAAIETVLKELFPSVFVGRLLLLLLPKRSQHRQTGCRKPTWRNYIPRAWKDDVSRAEPYWEQVTAYTEPMSELSQNSSAELNENERAVDICLICQNLPCKVLTITRMCVFLDTRR